MQHLPCYATKEQKRALRRRVQHDVRVCVLSLHPRSRPRLEIQRWHSCRRRRSHQLSQLSCFRRVPGQPLATISCTCRLGTGIISLTIIFGRPRTFCFRKPVEDTRPSRSAWDSMGVFLWWVADTAAPALSVRFLFVQVGSTTLFFLWLVPPEPPPFRRMSME